VDDEEIVRKIGSTALRRHGYEVLLAENGKQAVEFLKEQRGQFGLLSSI
jgi:CheY-like chemotaxis protein